MEPQNNIINDVRGSNVNLENDAISSHSIMHFLYTPLVRLNLFLKRIFLKLGEFNMYEALGLHIHCTI